MVKESNLQRLWDSSECWNSENMPTFYFTIKSSPPDVLNNESWFLGDTSHSGSPQGTQHLINMPSSWQFPKRQLSRSYIAIESITSLKSFSQGRWCISFGFNPKTLFSNSNTAEWVSQPTNQPLGHISPLPTLNLSELGQSTGLDSSGQHNLALRRFPLGWAYP